MLASICQSTVLHTLRLWSSAWEAMYFPTGSHVRPFTNPVCPRRQVTISGETQRRLKDELMRTVFLFYQQVFTAKISIIEKELITLNSFTEEICSMSPTRKFTSIPNDDGIVHTAGGQPHIMRRPSHVHHICKQNRSPVWSLLWRATRSAPLDLHMSGCLTSSVVPQDSNTSPLLHIGQLTAWSKNCARTDESMHGKKMKQVL